MIVNYERKIFGVGLSRTGTTSLAWAMNYLGFTTVHFPSSMKGIERNMFANDTPVSARMEELGDMYPDALFVLTTRDDTASWVRSCLSKFQRPTREAWCRGLSVDQYKWFSHSTENLYGCELRGLSHITKDQLLERYALHKERVFKYMNEHSKNLLVLDLADTNKVGALCGFLERHGVLVYPSMNAQIYKNGDNE